MLEFDTPFRRSALKWSAPNTAKFDPQLWWEALKSADATDDDKMLTKLAFWIYRETSTVRRWFEENPGPDLGSRQSTMLALATLNRKCVLVRDRQFKNQKEASDGGIFAVDYLSKIPVGGEEQKYFDVDASSIVDSFTDGVESWLYHAADIASASGQVQDLAGAAQRNAMRFSAQRAYYDLWQQGIWEGWRLYGKEDEILLFGPERPDTARLFDACLHRNESVAMGLAWVDISTWPMMAPSRRREISLPKSVVGIEMKPGRARRFVVGRPSTAIRTIPPYAASKAVLEASYINPFMQTPFPDLPRINGELLLVAWHVLEDLAARILEGLPENPFLDWASVRRWALTVKRKELLDVLERAMQIDTDLANEILRFLTWSKGVKKGIWGAPLVPLPGSEEYVIAANVLRTSTILRRAEIWLQKGKVDASLSKRSRGDAYESLLRSELRTALMSNETITDKAVAEHAIKKTADFDEQIDLLVQIGDILVVGEVKCFLVPADARERYQFVEKLASAAGQANRKATALRERPDIAAKALGIDLTKAVGLRITSLVVINHGFGMSLTFDRCPVVDAAFLKLYLHSGSYIDQGVIDMSTGGMIQSERDFYRTTAEAAANFERIMIAPPTLVRFINRLRWSTFNFPTCSGKPLVIERTVLEDFDEEERGRYARMHALLGEAD